MSESYLESNKAQHREFVASQGKPTEILLDPKSSQAEKADAMQRLDGLPGTTAPVDPSGQLANEKPPDYDGQDAVHRVIEGGRHTDRLS